MSRPDDRPLKRLPQLEGRKAVLERCVFCPKLCRTACPVSNAEPRETLTPWGKMSMAYFVANGSVALEPSFADPAWACTGCFGCREQCDHENDVAGTLFEARSALVEHGVGPRGASRVLDRFEEQSAVLGKRAHALSVLSEVDDAAPTALLLGCAYAQRAAEESRDAVRATAKLVGGPVSLVKACCGAPLLYAGDKKRFVQQGERLAKAIAHKARLIVVDAGCASTIRVHHAAAGVGMGVPVEHFAEHAARELGKMKRVPQLGDGPVRYHESVSARARPRRVRAAAHAAVAGARAGAGRVRAPSRRGPLFGRGRSAPGDDARRVAGDREDTRRRAHGVRRRYGRHGVRVEPAHVPSPGRGGRRSRHRRRAGARRMTDGAGARRGRR